MSDLADNHATPQVRPHEIIAARVAAAVIARLPADLASVVENYDPLALEAYACLRRADDRRSGELAVRDAAVGALARLGLSAAEIAREMERYAGNGWSRDRLSEVMPSRYVGRPQAHLWLMFKCYPFPLKRVRIAQIIENIEHGCHSRPILSDTTLVHSRPNKEIDHG